MWSANENSRLEAPIFCLAKPILKASARAGFKDSTPNKRLSA
jgi:hypothetical protein